MQVDLNELANSYEVVPVSLSDPFKSLVAEPSTMEVLRFIPIIAFIALIITAVWRQGMKFPVKAIGDLKKTASKIKSISEFKRILVISNGCRIN